MLQPALFLVLNADLAALDARLAGCQEPILPIARSGHCHPILS